VIRHPIGLEVCGIYECDRPELGDPWFEDSLERVDRFVEECANGAFSVAGTHFSR
jgi:hypothetical protein